MAIKIAINGFGRIGRLVFRAALENPAIEVVSINDLADLEMNAHLLRYDSVHGKFDKEVVVDGDKLVVDGKPIRVTSIPDPAALPHDEVGAEYVIESTGRFVSQADAEKHIKGNVKKVIVSAPGKGVDFTVVLGVNDDDPALQSAKVVSNASCTTNCLAPPVKVLDDLCGVEKGFMTTIHSYTNDQRVLDLVHKDKRRARAAAINMIPTTTGAARAIGLVMPHLNGKLDGFAIRVPTPNVSMVDLVAEVKKEVTKEEVNAALKAAADGPMKGILGFEADELVSGDFNHNPNSSTIDAPSTLAMGNMVKIVAWYDNEWGYSNRCVDLVAKLG